MTPAPNKVENDFELGVNQSTIDSKKNEKKGDIETIPTMTTCESNTLSMVGDVSVEKQSDSNEIAVLENDRSINTDQYALDDQKTIISICEETEGIEGIASDEASLHESNEWIGDNNIIIDAKYDMDNYSARGDSNLDNFPKADFWSTTVAQKCKMENELLDVYEDGIEDATGVPKGVLHEDMRTLWNIYNSINPFYMSIASWAELRKDETEISWLDSDGVVSAKLSYLELKRKSEAVAMYMKQEYNLRPGSRVILCFPPGLGFIVAFYACLFSGIIAVPVYPPTPANQNADIDRFLDIRKNAEVTVILTEKMYSRVARMMRRLWVGGDPADMVYKSLGSAKWVCIEDALKYRWTSQFIPETVCPWTPAFLQFTSGSTSTPKGVVVTHGSLLHNCHVCGNAFGFPSCLDDPNTNINITAVDFRYFIDVLEVRHSISQTVNGHPVRVFSWLPVYHDMGLIGGMIAPLFGGMELFQMSPIEFIRRPELWLASMSEYRCSACAAPNFAFELAARRTSEATLAKMNLSHLCGIICGAEPIKLCTMQKFFKMFSSVGLSEEVIIPAYGLAENTLIVSSRARYFDKPMVLVMDSASFRRDGLVIPNGASTDRGLLELTTDTVDELNTLEDQGDDHMTLVGCGPKAPQVEVRIVDPNTKMEVEDGICGEIWFTGASKARGYYKLYAKTQEDFMGSCTLLNGSVTPDIYVRSGDSGFFFQNELFIAGRIKDMLIIRGKNFYPQDIEMVLDSIPELRAGCSVCFANEDEGQDELCVAVEIRDGFLNQSYLSGAAKIGSCLPAPLRQKCTNHPRYDLDEHFFEYIAHLVVSGILRRVNLRVSRLYMLKGRSIAKTTSGKVRRHAAKATLLGVDKNPGLLYYKVYEQNDEKSGPDLSEIEFISEWPEEAEDALNILMEEFFAIVMICVPSDVLPRVPVNKQSTGGDLVHHEIGQFLKSSLSELGMDSPASVEFGERLKKRIWKEFCIFQLELPLICPTLAHLVLHVLKNVTGHDMDLTPQLEKKLADIAFVELTKERSDYIGLSINPEDDMRNLCDRIQISPASCDPVKVSSEWRNILITGATGSLGSWQMRYMLQYFPNIHIYILVRGSNEKEAFRKLTTNEVIAPYLEGNLSRVTLLLGDITRPRFGIESEYYKKLSKTIDVIIHTAADINLFRSYRVLRQVNVLSTLRIIEFAGMSRLKPVHFASTLGIYPQYFGQFKGKFKNLDVNLEYPSVESMKATFPPNTMGYPWTKLACEKLLTRANAQGLPCTIYRYPLTCMSYEDGRVQKDNLTIPLMLTAVQEGIIPKGFAMMSTTPSDVVAFRSILIAISGVTVGKKKWCPPGKSIVASDAEPVVLNMTDTRVISSNRMVQWLGEIGLSLQLTDYSAELIHAAQARGGDSSLKTVLPMIRSPLFNHLIGDAPSSGSNIPVNTSSTDAYLDLAREVFPQQFKAGRTSWPDLRELFKRSFLYMIRTNLIAGISGDVLSDGSTIKAIEASGNEHSTLLQTKNMVHDLVQSVPVKETDWLSVKGRLLISMFVKYSYAIADELRPLKSVNTSAAAYESLAPTVLLVVGSNKDAVNKMQNLLVLSSENGIVSGPSIQTCMPRGAAHLLGEEMLELYRAIGILGCYHSSGVRLAAEHVPFQDLVELPVDDTILLEMLPDDNVAGTTELTYGMKPNTSKWTKRYQYHKQYLYQRDIYREGQIIILNSDLHLLHLDELREVYGNMKILHVKDNRDEVTYRSQILKDAKLMGKAILKEESDEYVSQWMAFHDSVKSKLNNLPNDCLEINSSVVESSPLNAVNTVYSHLREGGDSQLRDANPIGVFSLYELTSKPGIITRTISSIRYMYNKWNFARAVVRYIMLSNDNKGYNYFSYISRVTMKIVWVAQRIFNN